MVTWLVAQPGPVVCSSQNQANATASWDSALLPTCFLQWSLYRLTDSCHVWKKQQESQEQVWVGVKAELLQCILFLCKIMILQCNWFWRSSSKIMVVDHELTLPNAFWGCIRVSMQLPLALRVAYMRWQVCPACQVITIKIDSAATKSKFLKAAFLFFFKKKI